MSNDEIEIIRNGEKFVTEDPHYMWAKDPKVTSSGFYRVGTELKDLVLEVTNVEGVLTVGSNDTVTIKGKIPHRVETNAGDDKVVINVDSLENFWRSYCSVKLADGSDSLVINLPDGVSCAKSVNPKGEVVLTVRDQDGLIKRFELTGVETIMVTEGGRPIELTVGVASAESTKER